MKRKTFIQKSLMASAGVWAFSATSYNRIMGANNKVRVGVVGFSDRFKFSLLPAFLQHHQELQFDITSVSDIWKYRREAGQAYLTQKMGHAVRACRNNEELYQEKDVDAVIISTSDFQHALHAIEAVQANCDAYVEKPFAETMADNKAARKAIEGSGKIIQIGSQRRSGNTYHAAAKFIQDGSFGPITMVELTWNVNQPGRWRRPELVALMKEADTDWKRFIMNRPFEAFDARKHLEYRLFWPYSSGMPGQWMSHQIDTVHWFSGLPHPRSVVANGGVYFWKDGRQNWDTMTAVFDYGPLNDPATGFQVTFSSRMHNGEEDPKEIYYSNGGELNLSTNKVSSRGGLTEKFGRDMKMSANLLPEKDLTKMAETVVSSANTGGDILTTNHMRNWMECVRSRQQTHAPVQAGYAHSIACIMTNAAVRTGQRATFDEVNQEVMAGGKIFMY